MRLISAVSGVQVPPSLPQKFKGSGMMLEPFFRGDTHPVPTEERLHANCIVRILVYSLEFQL